MFVGLEIFGRVTSDEDVYKRQVVYDGGEEAVDPGGEGDVERGDAGRDYLPGTPYREDRDQGCEVADVYYLGFGARRAGGTRV